MANVCGGFARLLCSAFPFFFASQRFIPFTLQLLGFEFFKPQLIGRFVRQLSLTCWLESGCLIRWRGLIFLKREALRRLLFT